MAKMADSKKTKTASDEAVPRNGSVGEMLRAARVAKNLSIEQVSVALRIRAAQLRVIEENNIDALPGMTYAIGFVRSYANYVGLDGAEVVTKFKAEYRQEAGHALSFPEPVVESRMPDPIMVGIGAFLAIIVLVVWTFYSNANNAASKVAEDIPPAPVATTTSEAPTESLLGAAPDTAPVTAAVPAPAADPAAPVAPATAEKPIETAPAAAAAVPAETAPSQDISAPVTPAADPQVAETSAAPVVEEKKAEVKPEKKTELEKKVVDDENAVINIKRGKSRITLQANQDSWVQITDAEKGVVYKKVLRPGEQYYVPDQPALSLVTANAGGLDVYVDGQQVPALGRSGEIVRGVVLDPASLRKKKIRVND